MNSTIYRSGEKGMTINRVVKRPNGTYKLLIVKMELNVHYPSRTRSPRCDFFKFLKLAPVKYSYTENNTEKQVTTDSYFIKGIKGTLRYHSNQIRNYTQKSQIIDKIFGTPKQESLIIFKTPRVIFSLHEGTKSEEDYVQIYHPNNKSLCFEIDVSKLDFEQTSFLIASILRFHRTPIKRGSIEKKIGKLTLKLVDRTLTRGFLPQGNNRLKLETTLNDKSCVEELKPVVKRAKEILQGGKKNA